MDSTDWLSVKKIYEDGISTGNATFETTVPSFEKWDKFHLKKCRFVAKYQDTIIGWAALTPVSERCIYRGVAEISVYVCKSSQGKGIGKALLQKVIEESEHEGIWTLQAGIFPENNSSIALHKKCGFREVGYRERLGKLNNVWRDVILLERRSKITGL